MVLSRGDIYLYIYLLTKGNSNMGIVPRQFRLEWGALCLSQEHKGLLLECSCILLNTASPTVVLDD